MESEYVANQCESAIAERLQHFNDSKVSRFTPSIVEGRRYLGFKMGNDEFYIEINVSRLEG